MAATGYAQSVVYSANGTLIGRFGTTDRQELPYNQIPQPLINAVVAAEDRSFWTEGGISPTGIVRAAYADVNGSDGSLQGGSTITQQFVRNYYVGIGTQQTASRKIKEIFVAMKVAKEKSKQWILQNYLNTIYLGNGAYGVQAAAQTYFGKPVAQLSVEQDAVIAALIQQPSTYPLPQYRAELTARWHYVLSGRWWDGHLLWAQDAATAKFPSIGDYVPQSFGQNVWDPYVMYMVEQELEQVYHLSQQQVYDGGYVIRTSLDDTKMAALYQAVSQNEAQIDDSSVPFESYMHAGAVLENPANGEIDALYPGPGQVGAKYNGTGPVITAKECRAIKCDENMAYQAREQVGSSFKPYILSAAVKEGMNVKTSTLNGYDYLYIPPDSQPERLRDQRQIESHIVTNDDAGENGPYTPQMAMAASINTAYADLWHTVAGRATTHTINNVGEMAQLFGVDTAAQASPAGRAFQDEYGVALGEASLTVVEQGSMLATIDDNGVYHDPHLITSISQEQRPDSDQDHQYQVFRRQSGAERGDGLAGPVRDVGGHRVLRHRADRGDEQRPANHRQDRHHGIRPVGVLRRRHPQPALTVALFTSQQNDCNAQVTQNCQSLNNLGGVLAGRLWRYLAGDHLAHLRGEHVRPARESRASSRWCSPGRRGTRFRPACASWPSRPRRRATQAQNPGGGQNPNPNPGGGGGNPNPYPTYSCDPSVVTCDPNAPATGG